MRPKSQNLTVAMLTRWRERCGISDYSRHFVAGLRTLPEPIQVEIVEPPETGRQGAFGAILGYAAAERQYRELGAQLGQGGAAVAHIQHQYFFFGGVAPHKNHARSFLDAARLPVVMTVHEIARAAPDAGRIVRAALTHTNHDNLLHRNIEAWIVHTWQDREALIEMGAPADRVHRMIHGIPHAAPLPDPVAARNLLGLEGQRVLTLFGFLSAKKGHRVAIDCLHALPPDVTLLFAGDRHPDDTTDYVPALRADIAARGLESRVHITGYLSEEWVALVMAITEIALAPYLTSSGSGSLANLLAYGRAIVASDIAPHREIAAEMPAALALFPSEDAGALAEQIQALLEDQAARDQLQSNARAYAARHSYREMAQATVPIYQSLC